MSDLRKAAEMALEAWGWDWSEPRNEALRERMEALRKAAEMALEFIVLASSKDRAWFTEKEFEVVAALRQALAQPEWVGLTDEDLKPLCDEWRIMYGGYVDDFAKAIEAKLKEKNT